MPPIVSLAGKRPPSIGVRDGHLAACPKSPNCVSSDADPIDDGHRVEAFAFSGDPAAAWKQAQEAVAALVRTTVVDESDGYLHAECASALLGFVDDLELHLRPADSVIAVRSASRLGYSDMGVNRKRVEALRAELAARGVVSGTRSGS